MPAYSLKQDADGNLNREGLTPEERAYREEVIPFLLTRAYHLPNNNWCQDLYQYLTNNHPVFGICLHHRFHPVGRRVRVFTLIGSLLFGLAITNIIYLAFVFSQTDYNTEYISVQTNKTTTGISAFDDNVTANLSVTSGNLALWTIGSALHATYDNVVWSLAACTCFMGPGITEEKLARYRSRGVFLVMLSVILVTALATFAVALRAALDSGDSDPEKVQSYGFADDEVEVWKVDSASDLEFITAYLIEVVLNYFLYYPVIGTILFSGCLTCGRYAVLGGRPFELKAAQEQQHDDGNVETPIAQPNKSKSKRKSKK